MNLIKSTIEGIADNTHFIQSEINGLNSTIERLDSTINSAVISSQR
jgi:archaellum component FlaC